MGGLARHNKHNAQPSIAQQGNKVNGLKIQQSVYGATISLVYGTNRVAGNIIDYVDFTSIPHVTHTQQQPGGKGGSHSSTVSDTYYTYKARFIFGICYGEISGIGKVWQGKDSSSISKLGASAPTIRV